MKQENFLIDRNTAFVIFLADTFKHALLKLMFANSDFVSKNHGSQLHNRLSFSENF